MSRLIDADVLLEHIKKLECNAKNKKYEQGLNDFLQYYFPQIIDNQPTAFDTEKVVEQLESLSNAEADYYYASSNDVIDREDAIEIVKGGGVDA